MAIVFVPDSPFSPSLSTSAVASPSVNLSSLLSTMNARRRGMQNSTPSRPPKPEISDTCQYLNSVQ